MMVTSRFPHHRLWHSPSTTYNNSESLLGLLTSDKPLQGDSFSGPKAAQTIGPRNAFNFGSKNVPGISFTENMGPVQQKNSGFRRSDDMFTFHSPGKSIFATPAAELANRSHEADGGSAHGDDDDDGPHFEPVVPLPDKIEVKLERKMKKNSSATVPSCFVLM